MLSLVCWPFHIKGICLSDEVWKIYCKQNGSFYKEVEEKRKGQKTRLQTDQEITRKKIFDLNKKYNVNMFSTALRGGKAFATKEKLKELKKIIFWFKALEKKSQRE